MKRYFLAAGLILLIALVLPVSAGAGSAGFSFLKIGVGSRPAALGEAVTASGKDITSAFYNPALLSAFDSRNQAVFMYNSYFGDVSQNYLSLAAKGEKLSLGGYLWLGRVSDIERRQGPSQNPSGTFSENHFIGAFGAAYDMGYFYCGLLLKYAYEKIDYASANAVMADIGVYRPIGKEITFGAAVRNLGGRLAFISEKFPLPREYRLGLAYRPLFLKKNVEILADAVFPKDMDSKFNFGAEYTYAGVFSLRAGYGTGWDSRGISFGGGIFYRQFRFDYALVSYKNGLGSAHRFTLIADF